MDLSPLVVLELFKLITDEDCELLNLDRTKGRPEVRTYTNIHTQTYIHKHTYTNRHHCVLASVFAGLFPFLCCGFGCLCLSFPCYVLFLLGYDYSSISCSSCLYSSFCHYGYFRF